MVKHAFAALLAASAFLFSSSHAATLIDFEGVGHGAQVLDYYNGGTDSMGNSGVNYGIKFIGGTVRYNALGAYLEGPFAIEFSPALTQSALGNTLSFLANDWGIDGGPIWLTHLSGRGEMGNWINGTYNPFCPTQEICDQRGQPNLYIPHDTLFGYLIGGLDDIYKIDFQFVDAADDLLFGASERPVFRRDVPADVPEPPAVLLLGVGMLGLLITRRYRLPRAG